MQQLPVRILRLFVTLILLLSLNTAVARDASILFRAMHDRIFQIQIIETASGSKSSLGSGFQIRDDGLLVTNFHVVADYVHEPEKYRIEYVAYNGTVGVLELLDIDVVNDLALVRHHDEFTQSLQLAETMPEKGEEVYSLGNPHDLGMTVVPGTYNSFTAHSYYQRILFSGSINPGMSGGPAVNEAGEVIGINVATSGNQLSFLVPVNKLKGLLSEFTGVIPGPETLRTRVQQQLADNQYHYFQSILDAEWPTTELADAGVIGEITEFIRCWGSSTDGDEEELEYRMVNSQCINNEYVYLSNRFITGGVEYEFSWMESDTLLSLQFYQAYQENIQNASPGNWAGEKDVTNFYCHDGFFNQSEKQSSLAKSVLCVRAYKEYQGLYDLLYIGASLGADNRGLISHFTLSGVEMQQGLAFTRRFMERVQWTLSSN